MPLDPNLESVLASLFRQHATVERPLESVRAQAAFLGISAPQLSRLRNGAVPLTRNAAQKFANVFGTNEQERSDILQTLIVYCGRAEQIPKNLPSLKDLNDMIAAREAAMQRHEQQLKVLRFARDNYEVWKQSAETFRTIEW